MKNEDIKDGLYLFYIKNGTIFPVGLKQENWDLLQQIGNAIAGDPIRVIERPLGKAEKLI